MMAVQTSHVTGGVDTHSDTHVAAALDSITARLLGTKSFPATPAGYRELLAWLRGFGLSSESEWSPQARGEQVSPAT